MSDNSLTHCRRCVPEVTDEMVERAAHRLHAAFCMTRVYEGTGDDERMVGITPWDWLPELARNEYRQAARAALEAALGVTNQDMAEPHR